jgi:2-polyprenyl-3-methyl-5-hydroxy-6-metoxy-1,4-benzoquinol methylase
LKIGILVVAYNAESTLVEVLERLPTAFARRLTAILIADDESTDATFDVGTAYQASATHLPIEIIRRPKNLGYGGNQKAGYEWAIERGLDIVVMLHGDGQYAPEVIEDLVQPLEAGTCDAVFGSRMLAPGGALRGGMPKYKYVGNKVLTRLQNLTVGTNLSEWHSGYRAYSVKALSEIPFQRNSDDFDFDTEIIIQLHEAGKRIVEVPIPTYYGDEICRVNGIKYGIDVLVDAARYRLQKVGFGGDDLVFASEAYESKLEPTLESSHKVILDRLGDVAGKRVLDVGCGNGVIARELARRGAIVTGIDYLPDPSWNVEQPSLDFMLADLEVGLPDGLSSEYDVIVAADILEHLRAPEELLGKLALRLALTGHLILSVPSISHWYPRLLIGAGRFRYDRRGILDRTHLRFFTPRSSVEMVESVGGHVEDVLYTGTPFEVLRRSASGTPTSEGGDFLERSTAALSRLSTASARAWPNLFAYQIVVVAGFPSVSDAIDTAGS